LLDEEGFSKPERQAKLATLFQDEERNRPVVVLDWDRLSTSAQLKYDRILEGPIQRAVRKANQQLKQSRTEVPDSTCSILFVVNNGYTALDHESLCRLIGRRVRQDTSAIDGIIVAGCYFHADGFDSFLLQPFKYLPINLGSPFPSLNRLQSAWFDFAERFAAQTVRGTLEGELHKGPLIDKQFDYGNVTYILPAPSMGHSSGFYVGGRPRRNTSGVDRCPTVAVTFPALTRQEWCQFRRALPTETGLCETFDAWQAKRVGAAQSGTALRPFAPLAVTFEGWENWRVEQGLDRSLLAVRRYANALFEERLRAILESAHELVPDSVVPGCYILAITEEIGQDKANDVSHIALIHERLGDAAMVKPLVENARIFHEHAVVLASAYALIERLEFVFWTKDLTYGWV